MALEDAGFNVERAGDGNEALEKIRAKAQDFISPDLVMPGKSGIKFMKDLLEDNGYGVEVAFDGVQALEQITKRKPDLILLDLEMPNETGTGLYRKLRGKTELKDIPVIIVSGLAGRNIAVTKSVTVIDKPPGETEILEEVRKVLNSG